MFSPVPTSLNHIDSQLPLSFVDPFINSPVLQRDQDQEILLLGVYKKGRDRPLAWREHCIIWKALIRLDTGSSGARLILAHTEIVSILISKRISIAVNNLSYPILSIWIVHAYISCADRPSSNNIQTSHDTDQQISYRTLSFLESSLIRHLEGDDIQIYSKI